MAYNNIISRADVQSAIPEDVSNELLENLEAQSAALTLFRRVRMSSNQTRMPVLSALPVAGWVSGDTGLKQTTEIGWSNKFLNVEELAAIVPIPEAVVDDLNFDIWDNVRPLLADAIVREFDKAVFLGINRPASWPLSIAEGAIAADNNVARPSDLSTMATVLSDMFAKVEEDGYSVDTVIGRPSYAGYLRRVGIAQTLTPASGTVVGPGEIFGVAPKFVMPGLWGDTTGDVELIAGQAREGIIGLRQDMTWKLLTEAVITDADGRVVFNLAQQDMVAMRVVFRAAYQVANTIKYENTNASTRFPFAVMTRP